MNTNKYLYTTNFALRNADQEIAPYLALSELFDANIKLLDTINNSLSAPIKTSKYGKQLADYVEKIKESMHTLDHSDVEAEIKVAVKRMTATLEAMEKITNESTEADCLQKR